MALALAMDVKPLATFLRFSPEPTLAIFLPKNCIAPPAVYALEN